MPDLTWGQRSDGPRPPNNVGPPIEYYFQVKASRMAILVTIVRDGITIHLYDVTCNYTHTEKTRSLVAWYSGRTLVFDQFTFSVMRSTYS